MAGVGLAADRELPRARHGLRRQPRPIDAADGEPRLSLSVHVLLQPVDVDDAMDRSRSGPAPLEMQHYQNVFGAENFDFYDLTAIVKKSWIVDFCRKIEQRGMTFTWQLPSGTRSEAIDDEVAEWLHHS